MLGADKPGSEVTLPSFDILHSGKTLIGSLFGGIKPKSDIPVLLKRYIDKVIQQSIFSSFLCVFIIFLVICSTVISRAVFHDDILLSYNVDGGYVTCLLLYYLMEHDTIHYA